MVEAGANQVPEERLLEALDLAQREIVKLCEAQEELRAKAGKPKWLDSERHGGARRAVRRGRSPRISEHGLREAAPIVGEIVERECGKLSMDSTQDDIVQRAPGAHVARHDPREAARRRVEGAGPRAVRGRPARADRGRAGLQGAQVGQAAPALRADHRDGPAAVPGRPDGRRAAVKDSLTKSYVKKAAEAIYKDLVRKKIAIEKRRPDGRSEQEIRAITCEVSVSPRTHGSGLFTRGQTQIMSLLTLGTAKEGQRIDDLSLEKDRRYMHHYNFPPYSVGETGRMTRPEAPRHRPRRARPAGARGRASRTRRTSRTRSASSRRRSSRTARRRWARSAARRSR